MFLEQQISILEWFLKVRVAHLNNFTLTILNCNNISQYYCFYCIFDQINVALVRQILILKLSIGSVFIYLNL